MRMHPGATLLLQCISIKNILFLSCLKTILTSKNSKEVVS